MISVLAPKRTVFQYGGSKLTWFECGGQNWLGFVRGVDVYFVLRAGRKWLGFASRIGINLVLVWSSVDLFYFEWVVVIGLVFSCELLN